MLLNLPLAIWFGIFTFVSLLVTLSLGIAMAQFHKNVLRYHKPFALMTGTLGAIHLILAYMLWFLNIVI